MGWKSTKTLTREKIIEKIEHEITHNVENLNDDTLCDILEVIGDDEKSEIYSGYNYCVGDEDE